MTDPVPTSHQQAQECLDAARAAGLRRVRAGKYRVDTAGFEEFLEKLDFLNPHVELIGIDEIGKIELFSNRFRRLVRGALSSHKQMLATIAPGGEGFIREIKQRPHVRLIELTQASRERLPEDMPQGG